MKKLIATLLLTALTGCAGGAVEKLVTNNSLISNAALQLVTARVINETSGDSANVALTIVSVVDRYLTYIDGAEGVLLSALGDRLDADLESLNLLPEELMFANLLIDALKQDISAKVSTNILDGASIIIIKSALETIRDTADYYD